MANGGGFITIHRKIEEWPLWQSMTADQRMVTITLLLMANWKDGEFWYGKTKVEVKRGELAHSQGAIAERARTARRTVRTTIEKLEKARFLGQRKVTDHPHSPCVITIRNYDRFQRHIDTDEQSEGQRTDQDTHNDRANEWANDRANGSTPIETTNQSTIKHFRANARSAKPADVRHQPLKLRLLSVFSEVTGKPYPFDGGKHAKAINRLIEICREDVEIERCWRISISMTRYPGTKDLAVFAKNFPEFVAMEATGPQRVIPQTARGSVGTAEDFGEGGEVKL